LIPEVAKAFDRLSPEKVTVDNLIYTVRGGNDAQEKTRIISARQASRKERAAYGRIKP
jgi:uncharacterized DUF497 family protein